MRRGVYVFRAWNHNEYIHNIHILEYLTKHDVLQNTKYITKHKMLQKTKYITKDKMLQNMKYIPKDQMLQPQQYVTASTTQHLSK